MARNRPHCTLTLDPETRERLHLYAKQNRKSMSQAVTDWVWTLTIAQDTAVQDSHQEANIT